MSMCHKAFIFDWQAFSEELLPILVASLRSQSTHELDSFIEQNWSSCKDPFEGDPLSSGWRTMLERRDVLELADFALTKYYDPRDDHGLHEFWPEYDISLPPEARAAFLGFSISVENKYFDPGFQGSYFQDPATIGKSITLLSKVVDPEISRFRNFLEVAKEKGVYITF